MNATKAITQECVFNPPTLAGLLRNLWPQNTAKRAAIAAGVSHRTTERWLSGGTPSADTLLQMVTRDGELRAELKQLIEKIEAGTEAQ